MSAVQEPPPYPPTLNCTTQNAINRNKSQIAFSQFEEQNYWILIQKTPPLIHKNRYSEIRVCLDGEEQDIWALNEDLITRFSKHQLGAQKVLSLFFSIYSSCFESIVRDQLPKSRFHTAELKNTLKQALIHSQSPNFQRIKVRECTTRIARSILAGNGAGYVCFTKYRNCNDISIGNGTTKKVKLAIGTDFKTYALSVSRREHFDHGARELIEHEIELFKFIQRQSTTLIQRDGLTGIIFYQQSLSIPEDKIYTLTQYSNRGDLHTYISKLKFSHEETSFEQKLSIFKDITLGLINLHSLGIIHGDLKHGNILLHEEKGQRLRATICDLGCSIKEDDPDSLKKKRMGSPCCVPPERLESFRNAAPEFDNEWINTWTPAADIWALGTIFFWLFHPTDTPFLGKCKNYERRVLQLGYTDLIKEIQNANFDMHWSLHRLLAQMLHPSPDQRPTAKQVLATLDKIRG